MLQRCAYTLTEVVATMAVASIVLATVTGLLGSLLASERQGRDHLLHLMSLDRLSRQFRDDVHAANEILPADDLDAANRSLRLKLHDGRVVAYRPHGASLVREEHRDGDEAAFARREAYRLPPGQVKSTTGTGSTGILLRMAIESIPKESSQTGASSSRRTSRYLEDAQRRADDLLHRLEDAERELARYRAAGKPPGRRNGSRADK